jgi:phytol kinase
MQNIYGLLIALLYVISIIGLAEALRRRQGYDNEFTRKMIHIGVGMLSWLIVFLFDSPWPFVATCLFFIIFNYIDWRFGLLASMTTSNTGNLGTVYFPAAAAVATLVLWEYPPLLVAALMPLTWGDGLAAVVGRRFGRRGYTIFGHQRTVEGSAAFFTFGFLFTWLAMWLIPGAPGLTPLSALLPAIVVVSTATVVEAFSINGLDNLTLTGAAILLLYLWPFPA